VEKLGFWGRDLKLSFFGYNIFFLPCHYIVVHHVVLLVISVGDRATANVGVINFVDNDLCRERFNVTTQFDFAVVGRSFLMIVIGKRNSACADVNRL
jgi:hypothetical protein